MKRLHTAGAAVLCGTLLLAAAPAHADVKTEERSLVRFEGMLGRVVGLFGGRGAREGIVSTVAVQGDRKMSTTGRTGRLIDLSEEKVYELDLRRKTYRVTTFAEIRQQLEEARRKAEEDAREEAREDAAPADEPDAEEREFEIDVDMRESGERKTVGGYDTREVITTVTVREKGRTLEESGGVVLTASSWLGPDIPALRQVAEFERRYAEKIHGPAAMVDSAQAMAAAMALFPGLQHALGRFEEEKVQGDGTPILTTVKLDGVRSAEQMAEQRRDEEEEEPAVGGGVGGLIGGLGRRAARRKPEPEAPQDAARSTIMTMEHEVLKVSTGVSAADVTIPADFKERR